jgi:uncharacterized protein YggE
LEQALSAAAKQALAQAGAIASGLGGRAGAVISAQQNTSVTPVQAMAAAGAANGTPVITGTVSISASVTVTVGLTR